MRRPKGIKTRKAVAKRFKVTGTGKILRARWPPPLANWQGAKRRRFLGKRALVHKTDEYRIKSCLPFSH